MSQHSLAATGCLAMMMEMAPNVAPALVILQLNALDESHRR